jgi:hypothetical protein
VEETREGERGSKVKTTYESALLESHVLRKLVAQVSRESVVTREGTIEGRSGGENLQEKRESVSPK